jgi:hypothetical protein
MCLDAAGREGRNMVKRKGLLLLGILSALAGSVRGQCPSAPGGVPSITVNIPRFSSSSILMSKVTAIVSLASEAPVTLSIIDNSQGAGSWIVPTLTTTSLPDGACNGLAPGALACHMFSQPASVSCSSTLPGTCSDIAAIYRAPTIEAGASRYEIDLPCSRIMTTTTRVEIQV